MQNFYIFKVKKSVIFILIPEFHFLSTKSLPKHRLNIHSKVLKILLQIFVIIFNCYYFVNFKFIIIIFTNFLFIFYYQWKIDPFFYFVFLFHMNLFKDKKYTLSKFPLLFVIYTILFLKYF